MLAVEPVYVTCCGGGGRAARSGGRRRNVVELQYSSEASCTRLKYWEDTRTLLDLVVEMTINAKRSVSDQIPRTPFTPFLLHGQPCVLSTVIFLLFTEVWPITRCSFQSSNIAYCLGITTNQIVLSLPPATTSHQPASIKHIALPSPSIRSSFRRPGNPLHPGPSIFVRSLASRETQSLAPRFSYA